MKRPPIGHDKAYWIDYANTLEHRINLLKQVYSEPSPRNLKTGTYIIPITSATGDRSYLGNLFQIISIDLPFIRVKAVERGWIYKKVITFDLNEYTVKVPSAEFIATFNLEESNGQP